MVGASVKETISSLVPVCWWARRRVLRIKYAIRIFRRRAVTHVYHGSPLTVRLADPLAKGWYDHDWPELAEITLLRKGRLHEGARVFDLGAHQGVVALVLAGGSSAPGGKWLPWRQADITAPSPG
jgi:hypothetical protein